MGNTCPQSQCRWPSLCRPRVVNAPSQKIFECSLLILLSCFSISSDRIIMWYTGPVGCTVYRRSISCLHGCPKCLVGSCDTQLPMSQASVEGGEAQCPILDRYWTNASARTNPVVATAMGPRQARGSRGRAIAITPTYMGKAQRVCSAQQSSWTGSKEISVVRRAVVREVGVRGSHSCSSDPALEVPPPSGVTVLFMPSFPPPPPQGGRRCPPPAASK
mmetsp:Transcript_8305/g.18120  ORF Transcript_8305/g.18120 Transcript_8305/m.18120 type:complete len:218 (+) Transcript_8305:1355-2008(+)